MKNKKIINFVFLLLLSFLISTYLISFVGNKMSTYEGYENEATSLDKETTNSIAIYIISVIPIYLIGCIYLLKKGIGIKYLAYPTILITCIIITSTLGICYSGQTFGWLLIFCLPFVIGGIILSIIIGVIQETILSKNKTNN